MAAFETVVKDLERTERVLADQLDALRNALSSLRGGARGRRRGASETTATTPRRRRRLSADARRRISLAQKARWARQKAGKK